MDKKNQNDNQKVEKNDDIDSFAKALLNKKTQMALFPEDEEITSESLDMSQRRAAEETMSSALDLLRKERGQVSIEEEEEAYIYDQNKDLFDPSKIGTESGVSFESIFDSMDEELAKKQKEQDSPEEDSSSEKEKPKKSKKKDSKKDKKKDKKKEQVKVKPISSKEVKKKKQKRMMILAIALFIGILLAGYTYKVAVYDPAHIVTEEQQKIYDKLIGYADEWDMLSNDEKLEIIDLEDDYDSLIDSQKEQINQYFVEQTDSKFTTLLKEMKKMNKDQKDENNPEYIAIMNYITGWSSKAESDQRLILNYQNQFNNLSKYLKAKVNDKCVEESGQTFISLCKNQKELLDSDKEKEKKQKKEELAQLQNQLNELNIYQKDLELQKQNGEDVDEEIAMNQQTIQSIQNQIQQLENQIAVLEQ